MNLNALIQHTRCAVLRDTALPYLWSDTELLLYLNEAEADFARRTHCLNDDTSTFTTFTTIAEQAVYELDRRIIFIADAGIIETAADEAETRSWHPLRDGTRGQVKRTFSPGRPSCYTAQVSRHTLRLSPVPDAEYVVQLAVARRPLRRLAYPKDLPEIDEDYHLTLCDYAAWRALNNNDPDGSNTVAAKEFRAAYDLVVRDAKRDMARLWAGANAQARANWTGKRR